MGAKKLISAIPTNEFDLQRCEHLGDRDQAREGVEQFSCASRRLFGRRLLENGYEELAGPGKTRRRGRSILPLIHKDPFDRILIAQSMVEGMTLLTVRHNCSPLSGLDSQSLTEALRYAVVLAQNSSKARMSSAAICCAVDCSMTERCMR